MNNSNNQLVFIRGPKEEKMENKEMIKSHLLTTALLTMGLGNKRIPQSVSLNPNSVLCSMHFSFDNLIDSPVVSINYNETT